MTDPIARIIKQMSPVGQESLVGLYSGQAETIHGPVALGLRNRGLLTKDGGLTPEGVAVARRLEEKWGSV